MWPFVESRYQRIVAVEHDALNDCFVLYERKPDGHVTSFTVASRHYFIVDDVSALPGKNLDITELSGPHPLRYLVRCQNYREHLEQVKSVRRAGKHLWHRNAALSFLIRSQTALFAAMRPHDLKVAAVDLEVYTSKAKLFADANDPDDRIILATVADNRGQSFLFDARTLGEEGLIAALSQLICREDYDVLVGHNITGFDLPYLTTRAARHRLPLNLGRDGGPLLAREGRRQMGLPASADYFVFGRHIVDTLPLLIQWDTTHRTLANFQLKEAVQALGLGVDRRDFDRGEISHLWDKGEQRLLDYAVADARDSLELYNFLIPAFFYQTQLLPLTLQQCVNTGTGSKVDLAMVRAYLERAHSLPLRQDATAAEVSGGLTEARSLGWHTHVHKADVASLYPSICLSFKCRPRTDNLDAFLGLLTELTARRLAAKGNLKKADALQNSLKVLINSFYGMLGAAGLHFADAEVSGEITRRGQAILLSMAANAEHAGGTVVELDTDGVYFTLPGLGHQPSEIAALIGRGLPAGIKVEYEGYFDHMYSYAAKNYVLFGKEGITRKGVVFRSRRLYGLQEGFIKAIMRCLAAEDVPGLCETYRSYALRLRQGGLTRDEVTTYVSVDTTWEDYAANIAAGGTRTRAFDLVAERPDRARWALKSRIYYYHAQNGQLKLSEDYTGDYDIRLYLEVLEKTAEKFLYLLPPLDWHRVFSELTISRDEAAKIKLWSFRPSPEVLREYERVQKRDFQLRLF
jgi:DNA polymerase elongation subunit (family B)